MPQLTIARLGLDEREPVSSPARNSFLLCMLNSFQYILPMLIGILQVSPPCKNDESPFKSHAANMWGFLVAVFIYYYFAAQITALQHDNHTVFFELSISVAAISGSLAAVLVVSMFLPDSLGYLIFIPWSFLPIIVAYRIHYVLIHRACRRLQQMIMNIILKFSDVWSSFNFNGSSPSEQPRLPV
ncbi:hypothetical protein JRO89_XS01G0031400 [Xanthoceras sorbifolium]|uniref:Uncharacterized protein n=1 Tax=Xanthoceras sorbifolium TaxID=99658 RepID=A0ABQ8IHX0_9ROSI|nr:hypothetical protein JRO89_XS01G0031400 [Xanthoceras sorbifolium]